jgi:erythromycin esterase-like protein
VHATLEDWVRDEAIPFSLDAVGSLDAVVDRVLASLGRPVELLGFGEALHSGEEILRLRNEVFRQSAEGYGFSAVAIESSFPRGRLVDDYIAGRGPAS